jgi:hypothetical protein
MMAAGADALDCGDQQETHRAKAGVAAVADMLAGRTAKRRAGLVATAAERAVGVAAVAGERVVWPPSKPEQVFGESWQPRSCRWRR